MAMKSQSEMRSAEAVAAGRERAAREGVIFGVPVGALGWFSSLLMGLAAGFAAFFGATFLGIVTLLVLNSAGHPVDYAVAYKRIGLPVGVVVGVLSLGYLGFVWTRRKLRGGRTS